MKANKWALPFVLALLFMGCTGKPTVNSTGSVYAAIEAYSAVMSSLTTLRDAGLLDQDDVEVINEWEPVAWLALQEWNTAVKTGTPAGEAASNFLKALSELEQLKRERGP